MHSSFAKLSTLILILLGCSPTAVGGEPATIRQIAGFGPGLRAYETQLIQLALKATSGKFGPYTYTFIDENGAASRVLTELNNGNSIQVCFSAAPMEKKLFPNVAEFVLPASRNLLGFRKLIIRASDEALFKRLRTLDEFRLLRPGQPEDWSEVSIYKFAKLPLVPTKKYDQLYPMLERKRFDYIPLSMLEIKSSLERKLLNHPNFIISNDVYIFYPLHVFIYYSQQQAGLAERIREGLELIFNNGEEEKLFARLFDREVQAINTEGARTFTLENPDYTKKINNSMITGFLKYYKLEKNAIPVE